MEKWWSLIDFFSLTAWKIQLNYTLDMKGFKDGQISFDSVFFLLHKKVEVKFMRSMHL